MIGRTVGSTDAQGRSPWAQRRKSVYPLPGGYDAQVATLRAILPWIVEYKPERRNLEKWIGEQFKISSNSAGLTIDFLQGAGILRATSGVVEPTPTASAWLESNDAGHLVALLHSRVQFIGEMIASVAEPREPEEVLVVANRDYSMGWQTLAQVNVRRGWLQSIGAIRADVDGRLVATELGLGVTQGLHLEPPLPISSRPGPSTAPENANSSASEPTAVAVVASTDLTSPEDELEARLRATASQTSAPNEFELTVGEAFRSLGYQVTNLGGPGRTDILIVADLVPSESYRVIVDCKTTSHEAVNDLQVDWMTLDEHRKKHEADFVALVGPAFSGARIRERARQTRVTLIDLNDLITLRRQHLRVPMGLDVYRKFFESADADQGAAMVANDADEFSRFVNLAAVALRVIRQLGPSEGPLSARDLYWTVRTMGEPFSSVTARELDDVLSPLAGPPLMLVHKLEDGRYQSIGSLATQQARLHVLAQLLGKSDGGGP